jgi:hypothetical protein
VLLLQVQTRHADDTAGRVVGAVTATADAAVHDDGTEGVGQAAAADGPATAHGRTAVDNGTEADSWPSVSWPSVNEGPAAYEATATDRDGQQTAGQQRMGQPAAGYISLCLK